MRNKAIFIGVIIFSLAFSIIAAGANEKQPEVDSTIIKELSQNNEVPVVIIEKNNDARSEEISKSELSSLMKNNDIESIIYDYPVGLFIQDSVSLVRADLVWKEQINNENLTGKDQTVCIIDTGINYNHPDLAGKLAGGYDFVNNDEDPMDDNGHGTHVAGIVAANGNIMGVAPDSKIVAIKVLFFDGSGSLSDVFDGIDWCVNNSKELNISVISLSLGTDCTNPVTNHTCTQSFCDSAAPLVEEAISKNISIVIATGNEGLNDRISFPACIPGVIAVAASDKSDSFASFSNRNSDVKLTAPGTSIRSTYGNDYAVLSGTSMAAPHAAGAIAIINQLIFAHNDSKNYSSIEKIMVKTGKKIFDVDSNRNYSRINVFDSVEFLKKHITLVLPNKDKAFTKDSQINFSFNNGYDIMNNSCNLTIYKNDSLFYPEYIYDDFSSGILENNKWEIRQDVEGQSLMEEYGVLEEDNKSVFHTRNTASDRRTYLFPNLTFTTGDVIEYDSTLISRDGTYAQMTLITGSQGYRLGMRGQSAGFDELGIAHNKLTFYENLLAIERITPSGNKIFDNLSLTNKNGTYEMYVGSFVNGAIHMDFDNFRIRRKSIPIDDKIVLINFEVGKYSWKVECLDSKNNRFSSENSSFTILPSFNFSNDTQSMDLENVGDISQVENYFVRNNEGIINWTSLDLSEGIDFSSFINISHNRIEVNSSAYSALNGSAVLTFKNITWGDPRILKNGEECSSCFEISYNSSSGEFVFNVSGFSVYTTDETPIASPAPAQTTSSGGGGGGGGGGSTKKTNSTNNTGQNSTAYNNNTRAIFNESLDIPVFANKNENSQVKSGGRAGITGAAINAIETIQNNSGWFIAISVLLLAFCGLSWYELKIKKKIRK